MNMNDNIDYLNSVGLLIDKKTYMDNTKKTVIVGMSGGVDSSVVALICKMQGHKTIGMFMKNWEEIDADGVCTAEEDYNDVIRVCEKIDIPYYSVNFSQEYRDNVFVDFVAQYKAGHTPNPDILCNREIKFKIFFERARELGADFLATGHYCQHIKSNGRSTLVKGADGNKDQTYFLYTMQEEVLKHVLFPIGSIEKPVVRQIAEKFDLVTFDKKDSTGICFIGERNFKQFLSTYVQSSKGEFVHLESDKVMGPHDGMCFFTPGQRKGLGLGGPGGPWFVSHKDVESNKVYIVEGDVHPALYADYLTCDSLSWVGESPDLPLKCRAKVRYRQVDQDCTVTQIDSETLRVDFDKPQRAIAIRQSVVFYLEDICLGGGIVKTCGPSYFEQGKKLPVF